MPNLPPSFSMAIPRQFKALNAQGALQRRPLAVLKAFWDSVLVIEEDADFLEAIELIADES